jgi:hypothetical protein
MQKAVPSKDYFTHLKTLINAQSMTSLGTDFETHVIWQGYIEDPAAKDFVARKACTIALSEVQGT